MMLSTCHKEVMCDHVNEYCKLTSKARYATIKSDASFS